MRTEPLAVAVPAPGGGELRIEWDRIALEELNLGAEGALWALAGEADWTEIERLRVLSGRIEDGRRIALVAVRPAGASGHGDEATGGAVLDEEGAKGLAEVLLSTEYGPDAGVRRVGLELYPEEGEMPLRVAGDATAATSTVADGVRREAVTLDLRLAGAAGAGLLEVLASP